jgi:putative aminopeptidase
MRAQSRCFAVMSLCLFVAATGTAQKIPGALKSDLREFVQTPAVPGYEQQLAAKISARLQSFSPRTDEMSNVVVTVGSGSPHRLIVAPMDEPGYVISGITDEGYLRVQRLPQTGMLPLFNELHSAQPVMVGAAGQKWIPGSVAGISLHLLPGRQQPPSAADLDNMFVDIGASSAQEARAAGVDLLKPMVLDRQFFEMANGAWTSAAIGDRFGDAALVELLRQLDPQKIHGTLTVAFVAQQWPGARGLARLLETLKPDELIYLGRLSRGVPAPGEATKSFIRKPGSGVLIGSSSSSTSSSTQEETSALATEMKQIAARNNISINSDSSAPLMPRGYLGQHSLPARSVHLAVATAWPSTPAELLDGHDVASLVSLLADYLQGQSQKIDIGEAQALPPRSLPAPVKTAPANEAILKQLSEAYGVSGGHEGAVRETIVRLLPSWAKTETDASGNLILRWGPSSKAAHVLVVAHQDEIGYEVHAVLPDGRLELTTEGEGVLAYFMGHPALVHSGNGMHPGVLELPEGWDKPDFQWPRGRTAFHLDVGAHTPEQAAQLGIKAGDYVTIPKEYHKLLGSRASARAFDDRIGCAALVSAVWALGPDLKDRDITFVWSTSEEIGLVGAGALAKRLAAEKRAPEYVFAVDTFVSSDSPLESKRFGDAVLGQGFVVRAVDNSNIVPPVLADRLISMARSQHIAVQYGVTGGGNDGSTFLEYGSTDVALGWPLRYSHSPGEVIDTRDLDGLAKIITAVARSW